ncbi:MAG TPA: amidohydrolase family protein [Pseudonocardiaceae bacterium]|jgi:predicted amidohydrolase YtcJ|nr:amidohydrolase family protein [Pseudonocardiaceae bacterium]
MARILIRRAEVRHRRVDVRIAGTHITDIGLLRPRRGELELDAAGGALLPGLHDHHLHLLSMARATTSTPCGPPEVTDLAGLTRALRTAPGDRVRGIGYHESVAGIPDRHLLDRLEPCRPVRVQHRGGALWLLNTPALTELDLLGEVDDGRLWRADALLRERLAEPAPDLAPVGRRLAALGITGVTDATPNLTADTVALLTESGLPQRLHLLGAPTGSRLPSHATVGPHKILPPDHEAPDWDELRAEINEAHTRGRPVAVHAVTREALVVTLSAFAETGTIPGDRIEHAAMVGEESIPLIADLGLVVVTQPGLLAARGSAYQRDIPEADHVDLYRYASLLNGGVRVSASSDAPFADEDPWATMRAAAARELVPNERVRPSRVLRGMLAPPADPGGSPRRVARGAAADLCLLTTPITAALSAPRRDLVAATICRGELVYQAGP